MNTIYNIVYSNTTICLKIFIKFSLLNKKNKRAIGKNISVIINFKIDNIIGLCFLVKTL